MVQQGKDGTGLLQQYRARWGEPYATTQALQQRSTDNLLQLPDLLAQRWLGDVNPLRGTRERAGIGDRHEIPQMSQLQTLVRAGPRRIQLVRHGGSLVHPGHLSAGYGSVVPA